MFQIIKRTSGFWHNFNGGAKEVNLSDFNVVLDDIGQTYVIQSLNGSNIPNQAVGIADIEVIDETDASIVETFATVELLRVRLEALGYTPYLVSGFSQDIVDALNGANAPDAGNPYATMDDLGGGGATNLGYTPSPTNGIVTSDTGTDATIPLADATNAGLLKPAKYTVLENTTNTNSGDETVSTLGAKINAAASATPNDTDLVVSVESSVVKKNAWTQIKAFLKTYFDGFYQLISGTVTEIATATTYTTVLTDQIVRSTTTSNVTVTIPANATVAYPIGKVIRFIKSTAGGSGFTIVGAGGVTFEAPNGLVSNSNANIFIQKIDTDKWAVLTSLFYGSAGTATTNGNLAANNIYPVGSLGLGIAGAINVVGGYSNSITPRYTSGSDYGWNIAGYGRYNVDFSAFMLSDRDLPDIGKVKAMISTNESMVDANITPATTTTKLATTVNLTANRTVTLPTIIGGSITVIDEKQTIYRTNVSAFYITIGVASGKTLNGVTNGTVFLGKKGQSIVFYHDGSGNYTYAVPEKRAIWVIKTDSGASDGFSQIYQVQNTCSTQFTVVAEVGQPAVVTIAEYNNEIHRLSSSNWQTDFNFMSQLIYDSSGYIYPASLSNLGIENFAYDGRGWMIIDEI